MASWKNRVVTDEHILPYVDAETASGEVKAGLNALPFQRNIFKLLANAPNYFPAFMGLLSRNFAETKALSPSEWQVTVLSTSASLDAPYEWDVNAPLAELLSGWSEAKFEALRRGDSVSSTLTSREQLIVKTVHEVAKAERAGPETMQLLRQAFTNEEVMEIFIVHGIYSSLARTMNSCNIDFDEPIPGLKNILGKTFEKDIARQAKIQGLEGLHG